MEIDADFVGSGVTIPGNVIARWKRVCTHIQDWRATLTEVDKYCMRYPFEDSSNVSRASIWVWDRNESLKTKIG